MDDALKAVIMQRIEKTMENLRKNNMEAYYVENRAGVADKVLELLHKGDLVGNGGSQTLKETGVMALLQSGDYDYLDRDRPGMTPEEKDDLFRRTFFCDAYLTSSNAITENGELYNVDGHSNRIAAMIFGPKSVIVVAGYNKIVRNLSEAAERVKRLAAPANCQRLHCETYCLHTGQCRSLEEPGSDFSAGCRSAGRVCCNFAIQAQQRQKGRIKVILVGEELGY